MHAGELQNRSVKPGEGNFLAVSRPTFDTNKKVGFSPTEASVRLRQFPV
jgi:hypothetical protein